MREEPIKGMLKLKELINTETEDICIDGSFANPEDSIAQHLFDSIYIRKKNSKPFSLDLKIPTNTEQEELSNVKTVRVYR